jgi:glycosyltransferase involved in cell wall biosynthesis
MSTIAHLGQGVGRLGGPPGYLAQLDRAFTTYGTGMHRVVLPPPLATASRHSSTSELITLARRVRRTYFGEPSYTRPSHEEARRHGGVLDALIRESWISVQDDAAASVQRGLDLEADVLFAHDAPSAELAVDQRQRGQQVWLLLHTPMPLPLYLAWCWGVPDHAWTDVVQYPDVQEWMRRELRAIARADRVLLPCADAVADLVRGGADLAPALARAEFLLTGGEGPARRREGFDARRLRESFDLPPDEPVGLFLGNPQPYRGLDVVLDALPFLPAPGDVRGVIAVAGCPRDRLPLHPRLCALGSVADVADLLATADFVINTNRFSLFDLSLIEAAQAGKPLLLHATGGNRTFASLGAGCRMIPNLEARTVAAAIAELFADAALRQELGTRSRLCWERELTPRHLRDRHIALYDDFSGASAARLA